MAELRSVAWAGCLAALAGTCSPAPAQEPLYPEGEISPVASCGKAEAAARLLAAHVRNEDEDPFGTQIAREAADATDVLNCNLDIELNPTGTPSTSTITGSNTFTVRSRVNGLTQFTFRLRSQFTITSALVNGSTPVTVTNPTTTTRIATLDRAYNVDEVFTLRIGYTGVPVSPSGSFGTVAFTTQNGLPLFQTLSEPYYGYTWWPCKDGDVFVEGDNSDKFTAQVAVTAPDTMASVSNGLLQGVDVVAGGKKKYRWATGGPICTYLVSVCSTPYNQWQQTYTYPLPGGGTGQMPVTFSIYAASDTPAHRAAWEKCMTMIATYRPFYGEYPFVAEKYGIYQFNFGGGEEHQTYTGQGASGETPFGESLTSHELGHQWWGDNVTCKTWHDIWLNEGFATFTESLYQQYKPGSTGWPAYFAALAARRPSDVAESVYRYDVSSTSVIFSTAYSYRKPGWVIHSLRRVVSDATFWNILAAYRAAYQGSAATTADFKNAASSVYGQDLTWFFDEWIMGPGAPAYATGWQTVTINGQNYLRLSVRQTQVPTYPVFTMPVEVTVTRSGGSDYPKIWNNAATEWYVIPISAPATGVVFDQSVEGGPWILATANDSEAYQNGPPKIVQSSAGPGATFPAGGGPSQVTVTFSENVSASAAAFSLTGPSGAVPFTFGYNAANFTATLTASGPLGTGTYTVGVQDTVLSAAASVALDGEIGAPPPPAPAPATPLPSGDGQPGGAASWTFTVGGGACYPDVNGDGTLDSNDFNAFLVKFLAADPYADCNADGTWDSNDFNCLLVKFLAGCP